MEPVSTACTGFGYDGKRWILIDSVNQKMLRLDQSLKDFRGATVRVTGKGHPPKTPNSTGRVELDGCLYYPSTVCAEWVRL